MYYQNHFREMIENLLDLETPEKDFSFVLEERAKKLMHLQSEDECHIE